MERELNGCLRGNSFFELTDSMDSSDAGRQLDRQLDTLLGDISRQINNLFMILSRRREEKKLEVLTCPRCLERVREADIARKRSCSGLRMPKQEQTKILEKDDKTLRSSFREFNPLDKNKLDVGSGKQKSQKKSILLDKVKLSFVPDRKRKTKKRKILKEKQIEVCIMKCKMHSGSSRTNIQCSLNSVRLGSNLHSGDSKSQFCIYVRFVFRRLKLGIG